MKSFSLPEKFRIRICMTVGGVVVCAIAVGFFKCSIFGVDPFQCLAQGIHAAFFADYVYYGTVYSVISLLLLVADLLLDRHYVGIATLVNLFFTGYIAAFSEHCISAAFPEPGLALRIAFLLIGIILMCIAMAFYMTSDLGVSVYDAIPIIISNRTGVAFPYVRVFADVICVIIGVGSVMIGKLNVFAYAGIGTVVSALCMGPLIEFFNVHIARPILYGKEKQ